MVKLHGNGAADSTLGLSGARIWQRLQPKSSRPHWRSDMGFRSFKRVHLIPGLRVNLSRSGPSLSIGHRGAWFTIGPHGKRVTAANFWQRLSSGCAGWVWCGCVVTFDSVAASGARPAIGGLRWRRRPRRGVRCRPRAAPVVRCVKFTPDCRRDLRRIVANVEGAAAVRCGRSLTNGPQKAHAIASF
jgi:hypothetical protein